MKEDINKLIDEALRQEPSFQLKADFKDRIVRLVRKKEQRFQTRLYLIIAFGALSMISAGAAIIAFYFPGLLTSFGQSNNNGDQWIMMAVMIGVIVGIVQYLDKKLVKDRMRLIP